MEGQSCDTGEEETREGLDGKRHEDHLLKTEVEVKEKKTVEENFEIHDAESEMKVYRCFQQAIQQVSFFSSSMDEKNILNNRCCYLFHVPSIEQIFVWIGRKSLIEDSQFIDKILPDLVKDLKCTKPAVVWRRLDDTTPSPEFQQLLNSMIVEKKKEPKKNDPIQVFQYQISSSSPSPSHHLQLLASFHPDSASYSTKLPMSILDDQLTLVIECGLNVYLWLGQRCQLPPHLSMIHSQFHGKRVQTILQNQEPLLFRVLFHDWDSKKIISSYSTAVVSGEVSSSPATTRRKSLVAERRASFTKHNSVPDISSIPPHTRQGSFYTKVQDQDKGPHAKWSLTTPLTSSDDHSASRTTTAEEEKDNQASADLQVSPQTSPPGPPQPEGKLEWEKVKSVNREETSPEEQSEGLSISSAPVPTEDSDNPSAVAPVPTDKPEVASLTPVTATETTTTAVLDNGQTPKHKDPGEEKELPVKSGAAKECHEPVPAQKQHVSVSDVLSHEPNSKTEKDNEFVTAAAPPPPHSTSAVKQPKQRQRQEAHPSSQRDQPSTIPIHQKNSQCFCM